MQTQAETFWNASTIGMEIHIDHPGLTSISLATLKTQYSHQQTYFSWNRKPTMSSQGTQPSTSIQERPPQFICSTPTMKVSEQHSLSKNVLSKLSYNLFIAITGEKGIKEGTWDSIHVVSVVQGQAKKASYRVASTVFIKMVSSNTVYGNLEMAGTLSKLVLLNP